MTDDDGIFRSCDGDSSAVNVVAVGSGAAVACFIAVRNEKAGCGVVLVFATGISGTPNAFLTPGTLRTENCRTCHSDLSGGKVNSRKLYKSINQRKTVKDQW